MALKADRIHVDSQIDFFMNEVAERGGIVSVSTTGSGAAMDSSSQLCTYYVTAGGSGVRPLGVLMCDMVNNDLTRMHENWHKEEVQIGGKVTIWNKCTVVTDRIKPGVTPTAGQIAYVTPSGYISNAKFGSDSGPETHIIGRFLSTKDEDGYAKVSVNLP
jgi:hypothetical protein